MASSPQKPVVPVDPEKDAGAKARNGKPHENVGGTPGGFGEFAMGVTLLGIGCYLFLNNVTVQGFAGWQTSGGWALGTVFVPMFAGAAFLFFRAASPIGWLLLIGGVLFLFVRLLSQMHFFFHPTTLARTLLMLTMIAGGLGLLARSLRPH